MMIVDKGDGTHNGSAWGFDGCINEPVADQIAESLGSICIALLCDKVVETLQQIGVNRDTNAAEEFHVRAERLYNVA